MAFHWGAPLFFLLLCSINNCNNRYSYVSVPFKLDMWGFTFIPVNRSFCLILVMFETVLYISLFIHQTPQ